MKITEKIYDITTGEETVFERDMTDAEIAERQETQARAAAETEAAAQAQAKRAIALAKLELLGLNEADLTALGL